MRRRRSCRTRKFRSMVSRCDTRTASSPTRLFTKSSRKGRRTVSAASSPFDASPLRLFSIWAPPRKNARYDQNGDWGSNGIHRNGAILISRLFGSDTWKEQVNYHQRSLVETAMFRIKRLFGERLKNRTMKNQWG